MNTTIAILLRQGFAAFAGNLAYQGIAADSNSSASLVAGLITWLVVCACSLSGKAQLNADRKAMVHTVAGVIASQFVAALAGWLQASSTDAADPVALSLLGGNTLLSYARGNGAALKGSVKKAAGLVLLSLMSLSLMSCSFLSSAAGIAMIESVAVPLAQAGIKAAVDKGKLSSGDAVTVQRGVAIVTNAEDPAAVKVFKLSELGLQTAINKYMLKDGDTLLIKPEGVIIQRAAVPAQTGGKSPVSGSVIPASK